MLMVVSSSLCFAQSPDRLDCSSISISPQLDDCVRKQLKKSNILLQNEFENFKKRTKRVYEADLKLGNELIEKVQKAQNAWVTYRDLNCRAEAFEVEERTAAYNTTVNNCTIRMNDERLKILQKLLN